MLVIPSISMTNIAGDLPDDLGSLLALDVLLAERHVTRAAKRLGVTQSALSQRLSRLRDYFRDPLLTPGRPLLALTPRAEALRQPLSRALADLRSAVKAGAPFDPLTTPQRFVILAGDLFEVAALPVLMPLLAREAPRADVVVDRVESNVMERLEAGTAHLAFLPLAFTPPTLRRQMLPDAPFVVLMRKDHPLGRGKLTLHKYLAASHLLVAPRGLPGSLVDSALERLGHERRVALRLAHFVSAPYVAATSDLLVTVPETAAFFAVRHLPLQLAKLPKELRLHDDRIALAWHERAHRDPGHAWLRTRLLDMIQTAARA